MDGMKNNFDNNNNRKTNEKTGEIRDEDDDDNADTGFNDIILRNELGAKYAEYKPKVDEIKNKLKHGHKLMKASSNLPITFLKENKYDIW